MLHIHHGNRLETLTQAFSVSYGREETGPFTPRYIVTESRSLARWLRHRFCLAEGIACLIETPLPADWLWNQVRQTLGLPKSADPLNREQMQWSIYAALDNASPIWKNRGMAKVAAYLKGDDTGLKRWQLAARIADSFDRYQYYRPELITNWSAGIDGEWQALLWRAIASGIDVHRVSLMERYLEVLQSRPPPPTLPERLDLFAPHNLPPLLLRAYDAIARHIPVHLWQLMPTPEYWADLVSPREAARKRRDDPQQAAYWEAGNPLLTLWGREGQAFQDLLLSLDTVSLEETEHFQEPARDHMLGQIQTDIHLALPVDDESRSIPAEGDLPSLQFHVCHGPMRECQVLRDTLLHCLQADSSLEPEDILVLVPEISRYAPFIEATFGRQPTTGRPHLPFNISDTTLADEHPLIRAFLELLELPESRFTRAEVLGLVRIPEVRRRFKIAEEKIGELAELFDRLRVYWGFNGPDKRRLNLPEIDQNTWHQGFQRLMAGFALGSDRLFQGGGGIAPLPAVAAQTAEPAARFFQLLQTLWEWSRMLNEPATAKVWVERLNRMLDALFDEGSDEDDRLSRIRETLARLAELGSTNTASLPPAVIRHWLNEALSQQSDRGRFYSGGITFCGMKPLRGVPFRIVCLMGMHDRAFPRHQSVTEFDLMTEWRHGDPHPGQEDRYLFLESVLAARERLIVSYTGRHHRTNAPLQPSVMVQELLDYLDEHYRIGEMRPSEALVRVHPLQPFSRAGFSGDGLPGFDPGWLATARAVVAHTPPTRRKEWPDIQVDLPEDLPHLITPQALGRFIQNPVRHFVQRQFHLFAPRDIEGVEEEPFDIDNLEKWQLRDRLNKLWLQGRDKEADCQMRADGLLPHGTGASERLVEELKSDLLKATNALGLHPPLQRLPQDVDLRLSACAQPWRLAGRLHHLYEGDGLLQISASDYRLADLLPLWIEHLCLHAATHPLAGSARYAGKDKCVTLGAVPPDEARERLTDLLSLYEQGLSSPLPFIPKAASAWMETWAFKQDMEAALKAAGGKWNSGYRHSGEREAFHFRIIPGGQEWQPDTLFAETTRRILEPIHQHLESDK